MEFFRHSPKSMFVQSFAVVRSVALNAVFVIGIDSPESIASLTVAYPLISTRSHGNDELARSSSNMRSPGTS